MATRWLTPNISSQLAHPSHTNNILIRAVSHIWFCVNTNSTPISTFSKNIQSVGLKFLRPKCLHRARHRDNPLNYIDGTWSHLSLYTISQHPLQKQSNHLQFASYLITIIYHLHLLPSFFLCHSLFASSFIPLTFVTSLFLLTIVFHSHQLYSHIVL